MKFRPLHDRVVLKRIDNSRRVLLEQIFVLTLQLKIVGIFPDCTHAFSILTILTIFQLNN